METIYVFDLMETEIYLDTKGKRQKKNAENQESAESSNNIEGTSLSNASEDNASTEEINKKTRINLLSERMERFFWIASRGT